MLASVASAASSAALNTARLCGSPACTRSMNPRRSTPCTEPAQDLVSTHGRAHSNDLRLLARADALLLELGRRLDEFAQVVRPHLAVLRQATHGGGRTITNATSVDVSVH